MRAVLVLAIFIGLAVAAARWGRSRWRAGDVDGALVAAALSAGAMFIAIAAGALAVALS
ncbi:hypothetical protein [Sphaerisporangium sp. NPDC051011]|uniref:hypothetical protein n=1 Tax=Sphaerisporangium sp. NPDC051011 TaxID=3155792 RepID=UPI0033C8AC10